MFDLEKCIGCGSCANDCLRGAIEVRDGMVGLTNAVCMECGHCVAACPVGAIQLPGYTLRDVVEYTPEAFEIPAERLLNFMKFRRSIRQFTPKKVEEETLHVVLEAGRYAPTGANRQMVRYIVLKDQLPELTRRALKILHDAAARMEEDERLQGVRRYQEKWTALYRRLEESGYDGLFYHAPCVVLTVDCEPVSSVTTNLNAGLASANMELMAHALGLGACYIGFFAMAVALEDDLAASIGLKPGEQLVSALALGYTDLRYYRTPPRKPAQVAYV